MEEFAIDLFGMTLSQDGFYKASDSSRLLATLFFLGIYTGVYFLTGIIFGCQSETYKELKIKDKMFWNLAIVRGVFGAVATLGGIYVRWFDETLWSHITESRSPISYILITNHLGFFLFEVYMQCYFDVRFKVFSKELQVHHWLSIICLLNVVGYDIDHYLCTSMMLLEMSTPFSCVCFCLLKSKLQDTSLWRNNQLVLIHLFHVRSVVEWMGLYEHWKNRVAILKLPITLVFAQVTGLLAISVYLTPYWTYKKTLQLFVKEDWSATKTQEKNKTN